MDGDNDSGDHDGDSGDSYGYFIAEITIAEITMEGQGWERG